MLSFSRAVKSFESDAWVELCNEVRSQESEKPREVLCGVSFKEGSMVDETDHLEKVGGLVALDDIEVLGDDLVLTVLERDAGTFPGVALGAEKEVILVCFTPLGAGTRTGIINSLGATTLDPVNAFAFFEGESSAVVSSSLRIEYFLRCEVSAWEI